MKFVLRELSSGLYVGSHSPRHAQLQELDRAYIFNSIEEAMESKTMMMSGYLHPLADFEVLEYNTDTL